MAHASKIHETAHAEQFLHNYMPINCSLDSADSDTARDYQADRKLGLSCDGGAWNSFIDSDWFKV